MHPLPEVSDKYLDRTFYTNGMNVEVTSMDITPHGSFLVAGCSNGSILLYDLTRSEDSGLIIGHITAKGLLTNLTLTVRITEECRFCFAGVQKGSSEMLAIDIGSLPVPWTAPSKLKELALAGQAVLMENVSSAIRTYSHSDAKLRGFASAVRVFSENSSDLTYRLACGKGIKNVHVWQFVPSVTKNGDLSPNLKADWVCIYDVASNGNTITHIEFRNNGMQMLSKSAGVNLRVWDTSNYAGEPTTKANYEDIVNSHDMKCILAGKFALGGTYEFAVLNVDAPREANRDVFEMPERPIAGDEAEIQYSTGLRRRRCASHLFQI